LVDLADKLGLFSEHWPPTLGPGQLYVFPRGIEHCPVAEGDVAAMLIEPAGVVNTGAAGGDLTAVHDESLLDPP
jgi:hypothetical protein